MCCLSTFVVKRNQESNSLPLTHSCLFGQTELQKDDVLDSWMAYCMQRALLLPVSHRIILHAVHADCTVYFLLSLCVIACQRSAVCRITSSLLVSTDTDVLTWYQRSHLRLESKRVAAKHNHERRRSSESSQSSRKEQSAPQ